MTDVSEAAKPVPAPVPLAAKLDEIFQPVNRSDAPGLVVGIAHRGQLIYRKGFGLASVELGVANTPRTRMRIGSTSKHFTCLAALLLAEEGLLDIDASVRRYLPELPAELQPEPTLRQLMNHTSGYRCYLDIGFLSDGNTIRPKGSALASQVRQRGANFPPGERMIYCNGGYHLLSLVIERVSGQGFEAFVKQRLFQPLGMTDTDSVTSDFDITPGAAVLHLALGEGRYRRGIFPSEEIRGEGAIISCVDDMLRWLAHLRSPQKRVGSAASWSQMLAATTLNNGSVNPYGLGLMRHPYRGVEVIHHAGGVVGGSCQMMTVPAHALDIIVINNGGALAPTEAAYQVVDAVLAGQLEEPRGTAQSAQYQPLVGQRYFAAGSGFAFGFVDTAGKLELSVLNSAGLPLREQDGQLRLDFQDVAVGPLATPLAPLPADAPPPAELVFSEAGNAERFVRLPDQAPPLAEAAAPLLGRYRAPDLDANAEIAFDGELLLLRVHGAYGKGELVLQPFDLGVFGWKSRDPLLPLTGVMSVQRDGERVLGLRVDTPRTRHIAFERLDD